MGQLEGLETKAISRNLGRGWRINVSHVGICD